MSDEKKISNLKKRVIIGIIGIPAITFIIITGGYNFLIFTIIVQSLCLYEFYKMFGNRDIYPLKIISILFSIALFLIAYFRIDYLLPASLISIVIIISLEVFRKEKRNFLNPVISIFGLLYITASFILLNSLIAVNQYKVNLVLYIIILIWVCDTFAYFGGKYFGKNKLSAISPKKTIEGSVIGLLFTIIASLIFYFTANGKLSIADSIIIGILTGVFGQIGDLFESFIKRYNDVKDSSGIIPGHGGVLDRFDSIIFVSPLIYIYFFYIKFFGII